MVDKVALSRGDASEPDSLPNSRRVPTLSLDQGGDAVTLSAPALTVKNLTSQTAAPVHS